MSQPVARLHSLRSVQLRVPTVAESTDFYSEVWGLSVVERERDETWLRGTGANHHVLQLSHQDCEAPAELVTVEDGGHTWPGSLPVPGLGHTTEEISAAEMIWEFFADKRVP